MNRAPTLALSTMRRLRESGAGPVGIERNALCRDQVDARLRPGTGTSSAARRHRLTDCIHAGIACGIEVGPEIANAVRAGLAIDVAGGAIAILRSAIAADFGPSRRAARWFDRSNRRDTGAAAILHRSTQGAHGFAATCIDAACCVRNEGATIVPGTATTIGP